MSMIVALLVKTLGPMIIGPVVTAAVKSLMAKFSTKLPPLAQIALSAAAGAVTAATTGDPSSMVEAVATGAVGGIAGSKGRDVLTGKTRAVNGSEIMGQLGMN